MESREFLQPPQGKILRAPSLKRGRPEERITDRIKLEKVLGVTVSSNAALTSDSSTETVAYPAGCTVVLLSTKNAQQNHIINISRKTVTSVAYSSCGRYLVTGECGHQPAVRVWDLQAEATAGPGGVPPQTPQIAEFLGHKYGVNCVSFSPNNKYVVSIGSQHDMIVNVWDWKNNIKIASNKVSTKVKSVAFAENGSYFVTVGNRHVKFWYLEHGRAKYKEAVPLMGRSAILGEQRNNYFCDVACGKAASGDSTYAITRSGLLCEFNNRRLLDKWVELRTTSANCMAVGENYIFVGCADGIVRCFDPSSLRFVTTLPRTHYLGVDVSQGLTINHMSLQPPNAKYPDAIAVTYDETNHKLTVVYNDHSLYVWAVKDVKRVGKSHSYLYHSACIWGVENIPPNCSSSPLPPSSFLTCSSDDTIRVWSLDRVSQSSNPSDISSGGSGNLGGSGNVYQRNVYSNELLKVVYVDPEMTYLKELDMSASSGEKDGAYDSRNGVRSIRLSPDGKHLASGDRAGNIRIHETTRMTELCKVEAHDAEVLCLEYSSNDSDQKLMASASRDRLIHVFDVNQGYNFLQTLDDHSSSITAVRFLNAQGQLQMVSCGADKSIIFRQLTGSPNGAPQFARGNNASGKATLYDMEVDTGQKHVITACQDRNIRVYSVQNGKHTKTFKGSTSDDGSLIKVVLDRSGIYVATSCTDKTLSVYDYYSGECMATMCGHSELATGLRFTNDCRRLISASGDGCIFVWKIPHDMVVTMQARLSQQAMRQGKTLDNEIFSDGASMDFYDPNAGQNVDVDYRFNVSALPLWAKKQITDDTSPPVSFSRNVDYPKGRWAQRAEKTMSVKSVYTDSVISFPSLQDRRADSDGSKDSSIDSGTESRTESRTYSESRSDVHISKVKNEFIACPESYNDLMEETIETSTSSINTSRGTSRRPLLTDDSALGSLRDPDLESTAHDGDVEDISDHESRLQPLYFASQQDSASGSEFPVNAMDVDELRRSQKKLKRPNLPLVAVTTASVSGSQDSDDDDDEASTPSGENTDRNPMSMFSVSSESLDQIVNREKYFQSTFESMSGSELEASVGKTSISSQHHTRNSGGPLQLRNVAVINAAKQIKSDPEATKKREELNKRIEETRRKLQSVGYRSNLKSSQSITDLSNVPEKDNWHTPKRYQNQGIYHFQHDLNHQTLTQNYLLTSPSNNTNNSSSLPNNLQLCGCYLKDIARNTSNFQIEPSRPINFCSLNPEPLKIERPRRLKLPDKKPFKHKSLPVSPVSEECRFSDFAQKNLTLAQNKPEPRRSFSYFLDLDQKLSTEEGLRQVCSDIQKFSQNFYQEDKKSDDDEANFSSDSLEDTSFGSKPKKYSMPRRCYSNNEIYNTPNNFANLETQTTQIPKSKTSFYLNPSNKTSRESILFDDYDGYNVGSTAKSYCNSLESVLSDDSECKSAPLEVLFTSHRLKSPVKTNQFSSPLYSPTHAYQPQQIPLNEKIRKSHTSYEFGAISGGIQQAYQQEQNPKNINENIDNYSSGHGYQLQKIPPNETFVKSHASYEFGATSGGIQQGYQLEKNPKNINENIENYSSGHGYQLQKIPPNEKIVKSHTSYEFGATSGGIQQAYQLEQNPQIKSINENIENVSPKIKKSHTSFEFQQKLLKFETGVIGNTDTPKAKKAIAYFIETLPEKNKMNMEIPSLKSKNLQYKSKYCNVLNNKPEVKAETLFGDSSGVPTTSQNTPTVFQSKENMIKSNTLDSKFEKKSDRLLQTTSLDRHLLSKSLWDSEKVVHKPPKAIRRNSSRYNTKNRRKLTQNNFFENKSNKNPVNFDRNLTKSIEPDVDSTDSIENVIELNYKEKNKEIDCEASNKTILTDIYDSLDKLISDTKIDQDSLENLSANENKHDEHLTFWCKSKSLLEVEQKNVWKKYDDFDKINSEKSHANLRKNKNTTQLINISTSDLGKIQNSIENIKILHEVQQKIHKINLLVDTYKQNITKGKVRVLSKMYETLSRSQIGLNNFTEMSARTYKRRNLSLPNFVERNLSVYSTKNKQNYDLRLSKSTNEVSNYVLKQSTVERSPEMTGECSKSNLTSKVILNPETENQNSLRRACSLSDLTVPGPLKPKIQVSGKIQKPAVPIRTNLSRNKGTSITRSSSTGVLNQSDSDQEIPKPSIRNNLMRPTISSQNKVSNTKTNIVRRRIPQSISTINLSTVGQEDSSSEETTPPNTSSSKPTVPPRPRSMLLDNQQPMVVPRRHTAAQKDKLKANRHSSVLETSNKENDVNVKTAQISSQLCKDVADQLTKAADNVVELYRRLADNSESSNEGFTSLAQKLSLVKTLEQSVIKTQSVLHEFSAISAQKQNGSSSQNNGLDSPTDNVKKINDLALTDLGADHGNVINFMNKYSDILLSMMQQKMANVNK